MKKIILFLTFVCFVNYAMADEPQPISIFSTSTDWHAVTGLPLKEYRLNFTNNNRNIVGNGLTLYYLDAFPCYGEADSVTAWISPNGHTENKIRLVCVHRPTIIQFAWKNGKKFDNQSATTGLLKCELPKKGDLDIDLSKCEQVSEWEDYK